jgi:hypothetical protein
MYTGRPLKYILVKMIVSLKWRVFTIQLSGEHGSQSMSGQTGRPFTVRYLMLETVE